MTAAAPPPSFGGGRYVVQRVLGAGGAATVYRVRDTALGVDRALKALRPSGSDLSARLVAEARAMAGLRHPNIVRVVDIGEEEGRPYLVMELVEGGSLDEQVAGHPLPARAAIAWTLQILAGLQAAHAAGIIHRDVKPGNVLIDEGVAKVADFGIARATEEDEARHTRTGAFMGTLAYMAPEQRLDARTVSVAADVYAAGSTLFYLLTARNPMDLFLVEATDPRLEGVPAPLAQIVLDATRYDPERRYPSAAAMAAALAPLLDGAPERPVVAPPPGRIHPARPDVSAPSIEATRAALRLVSTTLEAPPPAAAPTRRSRRPLLAAGLLGALVAGTLVVLGSTRPWQREPPALIPSPAETPSAAPAPEPGPAPAPAPAPAPEPEPEPVAATPARPIATPPPPPAPRPAPTGAAAPFPAGAWTGMLNHRPVDLLLSGPPDALVADVTAWFSEADRAAGTEHRQARVMTGAYRELDLLLADASDLPGGGTIRATWDGARFRGSFEVRGGRAVTVFEMAPR